MVFKDDESIKDELLFLEDCIMKEMNSISTSECYGEEKLRNNIYKYLFQAYRSGYFDGRGSAILSLIDEIKTSNE